MKVLLGKKNKPEGNRILLSGSMLKQEIAFGPTVISSSKCWKNFIKKSNWVQQV